MRQDYNGFQQQTIQFILPVPAGVASGRPGLTFLKSGRVPDDDKVLEKITG
jgi:hypothetical protein